MSSEALALSTGEHSRSRFRQLAIVTLSLALPVLHLTKVGAAQANLCAADPIVGAGLVWLVWTLLFGRPRLPLFALFCAAAAVSILSIVMNSQLALSAKGPAGIFIAVLKALYPWAYFYLAVNLTRRRDDLLLFIHSWIAGSGFVALSGICGAISYLMTGIENMFALQYRAHGTMGDANFFSMHLGVSFCLTLFCQTVTGRRPRWHFAVMGLQMAGIILSASRSGMLAFGCALAAVLVYTSSARTKVATLAVLTGAVLLFALGPASPELIASNPFTARLATTTFDVRNTDRAVLWAFAWNSFLESPLFGVGYDNGSLANSTMAGRTVNETHNTYLGIVSEMGIAGFLVYCAVILFFPGVLFHQWMVTHPEARTRVNWFLMAAFLNIAILGLAVNVENYRGLWLLMAIAYWHVQERRGLTTSG